MITTLLQRGGKFMAIKATICIDDDRWAKHPYGVEFDDLECQSRFGVMDRNKEQECYDAILRARKAGYDVDMHVEERFY